MGAQATRLSDVKVKAAKPKEKDYILTDGNGLQMRENQWLKAMEFQLHPTRDEKADKYGIGHLS